MEEKPQRRITDIVPELDSCTTDDIYAAALRLDQDAGRLASDKRLELRNDDSLRFKKAVHMCRLAVIAGSWECHEHYFVPEFGELPTKAAFIDVINKNDIVALFIQLRLLLKFFGERNDIQPRDHSKIVQFMMEVELLRHGICKKETFGDKTRDLSLNINESFGHNTTFLKVECHIDEKGHVDKVKLSFWGGDSGNSANDLTDRLKQMQ